MTDTANSMALALLESMISDCAKLLVLLHDRAGESTVLVALNALSDAQLLILQSEEPKLA